MYISPLEVLGGALPVLSYNNGVDDAGNAADPVAELTAIGNAITTGDYGYFFGEPSQPVEAVEPDSSAVAFANSLAQLKAQASASALAQLLSAQTGAAEPEYSFILKPVGDAQPSSAAGLARLLSATYGQNPRTATTFNLLG